MYTPMLDLEKNVETVGISLHGRLSITQKDGQNANLISIQIVHHHNTYMKSSPTRKKRQRPPRMCMEMLGWTIYTLPVEWTVTEFVWLVCEVFEEESGPEP